MSRTKIKNLMTPNPAYIAPSCTLKEVAEKMHALGCGILPVGTEEEGILGIITDRDIVIRAVAAGKDINEETVRNYMTPSVYSCREEDTLERAADMMRDYRVTRLLVMNKDDRVSGIISFGSILRKDKDAKEITDVIDHAVGRAA